LKIAIVDDEDYISDNIKTYLTRKDMYEIDTYNNPILALDHTKYSQYDVILLDINMPQMDGIEFLENIKSSNKNQKVIMMTANSNEDKLIKCDKLGVDDYITKPFISLKDVENKILDVVN
jgi:DNA-binding response OmpR family regulator